MADETEQKDVQVVTKTETTEVIDSPGHNAEGVRSLSSMFDKIVEGKTEGKSAKEIVSEQPKPEKKEVKVEPVSEDKNVGSTKAEESELSKKLDEKQTKKDDDAEVSREKLREATEEKKKEEKKVEPAATDEDTVPEEEMKVLSSDKPKTAKRIQALLKKIEAVTAESTKTKAEAQEKAAKLAEYEKKLTEVKTVDPETQKKIDAQQEEFAMLRRRFELDKDPEVSRKYDSRVEQAEDRIVKQLTARNAGKPLLDLIKEEGGFVKFSQSTRTLEVGGESVSASELADRILQALPLGERKVVEAAMMDQVQTKMEKERFLKEEQDKAVQYFKQKDEETTRSRTEYEKQVAEGRKAIEEFQNRTLQAEWLKDKDVPANATPTEKAAAEEHNKYNAQLRAVLKKAVGAKELPELFEVITDSVRYYDERRTSKTLRDEVSRLKSELQAKQLEINKFKGAGRSVPKAGSIATPAASDDDETDELPKGIGAAFDRIQRFGTIKAGSRNDE